MQLGRYVALTLIGSAVWAFALAAVGWGVGNGYRSFHSSFNLATAALVAILALFGLVLAQRRHRARSAG